MVKAKVKPSQKLVKHHEDGAFSIKSLTISTKGSI